MNSTSETQEKPVEDPAKPVEDPTMHEEGPVGTSAEQALAGAADTAPGSPYTAIDRARVLLHGKGSLIALVLLIVVAIIVSPGFLTVANIRNILTQNAPVAVIAVAMTLLIVARDLDISVGGIYAIGSVEFAHWTNSSGLLVGFVVALLSGLICGLINGFVVVGLRVNAFVATLGTGAIFSGAALELAHNSSIFVTMSPGFQELGNGRVIGIPYCVLVLAGLFLVATIFLRSTSIGRHVYAIGGNPKAAYLAGLRAGSLRVALFAAVGICAALGGMILSSQVGVGEGDIGGTVALQAIAIVVVGGTSLHGGEGGAPRTIIGVLILGIIVNVIDSLALNAAVGGIIQGLVIVIAVAADAMHDGGLMMALRNPRLLLVRMRDLVNARGAAA